MSTFRMVAIVGCAIVGAIAMWNDVDPYFAFVGCAAFALAQLIDPDADRR